MKANEFRIGNWIYIPQTKTNEQIGSIEENGRFTTKNYKSSYSSIECLEPIPLTKKWLLKFGFERSMSWTYVIELQGNLKLVYYLGEKGWSIGFKAYSDFSNLEYVHQLQNLYFALTGEELKIKENETI